MVGWWIAYFVVIIISAVLAIVLAPKPSIPAVSAGDLQNIPVVEQGKPIPVLFGTRFIMQPNVIWWGGAFNTPIRKEMGSGGSS